MHSSIFVYGEGSTEVVVFRKIIEFFSFKEQVGELDLSPVNGKKNFPKEIINDLGSELNPGIPDEYVRVIVFRDVDEGETVDSIRQSFTQIIQKLAGQSPQFQRSTRHTNVFIADVSPTNQKAGLYFVLHLAGEPPLMAPELTFLKNKTTDTYLLGLALLNNIVQRFAKDAKTTSVILRQKVISDLPEALKNGNGIFCDSDKDFLAAYLFASRFWKVKRTEAKERLLSIILDRAAKHTSQQFEQVFDSWKIAVEEAIQ